MRAQIAMAVLLAACILVSGCSSKIDENSTMIEQIKQMQPAGCNGSIELLEAKLDNFFNTVKIKINNTGKIPLYNFTVISYMDFSQHVQNISVPSKPGQVFEVDVPVTSAWLKEIYITSRECMHALMSVRDYEIKDFNFSKQGNST